MPEKILAIIPAYNEEKKILKVIGDIKEYFPKADILVVNDASSDGTSALAHRAEVRVLDLAFNVGIGTAVQAGFSYARDHGYDFAVQVDADGQHCAKELPQLLAAMRPGQARAADMVIASRFLEGAGYTSSFLRKIGIYYFSWLIGAVTGKKITDPTSGFRMINRNLIYLFSGQYAEDYPEPESIVLALKCSFVINEIPTVMFARTEGRSSINALKAMYYMAKVTLAILIAAYRGRYAWEKCS